MKERVFVFSCTVTTCDWRCPNNSEYNNQEEQRPICRHTGRIIEINTHLGDLFPEWCPLKEKEDKDA